MTFSEQMNSVSASDETTASLPISDEAVTAATDALSLVDLASHTTMEEALPFTVEWAGTSYRIFVPRSVLEDLDHATSYRQDEQLVAAFKRNEELILKRTLAVLEKGRGRWGTVLLKQYDFPELFQ
jgi:hypothetical protein